MELMVNYDRAIVIDAISTGKTPAGHVSCFALESLTEPTLGHLASPHDTSLITALKVGRSLHARLPEQVTVIAIEITNKYEFSEQLTPAVAAAIPQTVKYVMENIL